MANYVYAGGGTMWGTLYKVWQLDPADMTKVAESAGYGLIQALAAGQDGLVYCLGYQDKIGDEPPTGKIWQIDPSDMSKIAESEDMPVLFPQLVVAPNGYVYVVERFTGGILKIDPHDLSVVATYIPEVDAPYLLAQTGGAWLGSDGYLYINKAAIRGEPPEFEIDCSILKINPHDMSVAEESALYENTLLGSPVLAPNGFVYSIAQLPLSLKLKLWKFSRSDLSKVGESDSEVIPGNLIVDKNGYLYGVINAVVSEEPLEYATIVSKYDSDDLALLTSNQIASPDLRAFTCDDNNVYFDVAQKIYQLDSSDLNKVAESADYGGVINTIAAYTRRRDFHVHSGTIGSPLIF